MKRQLDKRHCEFIRALPCLVCGNNVMTECAHIRYAEPRAAKRPTGLGERPDDDWTVPLCGRHHRLQHTTNEKRWWTLQGIDPVFVALALRRVTGDHGAGVLICEQHRTVD